MGTCKVVTVEDSCSSHIPFMVSIAHNALEGMLNTHLSTGSKTQGHDTQRYHARFGAGNFKPCYGVDLHNILQSTKMVYVCVCV